MSDEDRDQLAEDRANSPREHHACPDCNDAGCPRCWDQEDES